MAIIVGDIHGNVEKASRFLAYRPDQPHVALGDYVDSFHEPIENQLAVVELLAASDAIMLWGNHDLHYLSNAPWRSSGYQKQYALQLAELFDGLLQRQRLVAAHWVDGWLCTHAGFAEGGNGLTPNGCCRSNSCHLADCINWHFYASLAHNQSSPLFNIPVARGGDAPYGGIFWLDPFREKIRLDSSVKQIFGHTEQPLPVITDNWVCLDTTNSNDIWVFDTTDSSLINLRSDDELAGLEAARHRKTLCDQQSFCGGF